MSNFKPVERVAAVKPSVTMAINSKAKALKAKGTHVINLSAGEPDFFTPDFIKQAAIAAINDNFTTYTAADGIPELKSAIIKKLDRDNQLHFSADQVLVTSGAKQALYSLCQVVLESGCEAIVPAPYWVSYPDMVALAEAEPVIINTTMEQDFKITPQQLSDAISDKTRLLFLNSPSNPTGVVYHPDELKALGEVLQQHPDIIIVSDEIYEYIYWSQGVLTNLLNVCPELESQVVIVNGVSKAHAMTGWRIGYAVGPKSIISSMKVLQSQSTSCATSIAQKAAVAALEANPLDFFPPMLNAYKERYEWMFSAINDIPGMHAAPAEGAFYLFVNVEELLPAFEVNDDVAFCDYMLEHFHIAMVPGTAFGAPGHVRMSCAISLEDLKLAAQALKDAVGIAVKS